MLPGSNIRMNTIEMIESIHDINQYLVMPKKEVEAGNIQSKMSGLGLPTIKDNMLSVISPQVKDPHVIHREDLSHRGPSLKVDKRKRRPS